jgi:homoserine dehydrogenase
MQQVNLGMIGGGTVGSGVYHALQLNGDLMASRTGVKVNVRKVAVKAFDEPRPYPTGRASSTTRKSTWSRSWWVAPPSPAP